VSLRGTHLSGTANRPSRDTERVSPRHVPASVTELSRIGLLASLPGERLNALAARMEREQLAPGAAAVSQGEPGERFYVVLSGLLNVSQAERGGRSVLRPGDYFGEVSLAMGIPRTATVRAMTPAVVASCDRETFDELLRPLFAEDED
jgi:CRP-like cAMP-binding protein